MIDEKQLTNYFRFNIYLIILNFLLISSYILLLFKHSFSIIIITATIIISIFVNIMIFITMWKLARWNEK